MSYLDRAKQIEARLRQASPHRPASRYAVVEALPFLGMRLDEFQARGAMLELRVPWLAVTLWAVPTEPDVAALMADGISRGRIWTAKELTELMEIADQTPEGVKTITHAKIELGGEITEVRRR